MVSLQFVLLNDLLILVDLVVNEYTFFDFRSIVNDLRDNFIEKEVVVFLNFDGFEKRVEMCKNYGLDGGRVLLNHCRSIFIDK